MIEQIDSHSIMTTLLAPDAVVLDAGASTGRFSLELAERFGCRCFAVEAAPNIARLIPSHSLVRVVNRALCGGSGPTTLFISSNPEANAIRRLDGFEYTGEIVADGQTLGDLLSDIGVSRIDVLKMDIEGAELAVLDSCSDDLLRGIPQVSVEFHEWAGAYSPVEVQRIVRRMQRIGFRVFDMNRSSYQDVLFVNSRDVSLSVYLGNLILAWAPRLVAAVLRRARR